MASSTLLRSSKVEGGRGEGWAGWLVDEGWCDESVEWGRVEPYGRWGGGRSFIWCCIPFFYFFFSPFALAASLSLFCSTHPVLPHHALRGHFVLNSTHRPSPTKLNSSPIPSTLTQLNSSTHLAPAPAFYSVRPPRTTISNSKPAPRTPHHTPTRHTRTHIVFLPYSLITAQNNHLATP